MEDLTHHSFAMADPKKIMLAAILVFMPNTGTYALITLYTGMGNRYAHFYHENVLLRSPMHAASVLKCFRLQLIIFFQIALKGDTGVRVKNKEKHLICERTAKSYLYWDNLMYHFKNLAPLYGKRVHFKVGIFIKHGLHLIY
jgi:hypothetical protein